MTVDARLSATAGARIVINYRDKRRRAENVAAEIVAAGGNALALQADLTRPAEVSGMLQAVKAAYGRIGVLILNASHVCPTRRVFGSTVGLPAVPVGELLDRLTIGGLEILPPRIRHRDQRSLLYLGVIDAQDRRHLFLKLEVDLRPG